VEHDLTTEAAAATAPPDPVDRRPSEDAYGQHPMRVPVDATEILLVRHGATIAWTAQQQFPVTGRHGDPPLSPIGRRQAELVADRLGGESATRVYVTPLRRTHETAAPLLGALGVEAIQIDELIEVHLGEWERGEYRMRMSTGDPVALRALRQERWGLIPNAEPDADFQERVRRGVLRIVADGGPGTAIAVLHAAVIAEILRAATGSRPFAFLAVDNASISRLVVHADGRWQLRAFNDVTHLRELE
jgi:probable phosphoglycerate mutase